MRLIDAEILRYRLYKTRNAALADGRNKAYGKGIRDAIEILEAQQTIEPELLKEQEKPKIGHWIPIKSPTGVEAFGIKEVTVFDVRCSVCGAEEDVSFTGYKYCPRCGAKMEGR